MEGIRREQSKGASCYTIVTNFCPILRPFPPPAITLHPSFTRRDPKHQRLQPGPTSLPFRRRFGAPKSHRWLPAVGSGGPKQATAGRTLAAGPCVGTQDMFYGERIRWWGEEPQGGPSGWS